VSESTQAEHRHEIAGLSAAVAQAVEGGDASAHQGRRLHRRQLAGHPRQRQHRVALF